MSLTTVDFERRSASDVAAIIAAIIAATPLQPNVFKPITSVTITTQVALWTPPQDKRIRLMGGCVSTLVAAGIVFLREGLVSTVNIFNIPYSNAGAYVGFDLGNGILWPINTALCAIGTSTETINGTLWGREET